MNHSLPETFCPNFLFATLSALYMELKFVRFCGILWKTLFLADDVFINFHWHYVRKMSSQKK